MKRALLLPLLLGTGASWGCESKLPGPIECETMAFRALGRSSDDAAHSPLVRRVANRLTRGCLTVPFDRATLRCVQEGRSLVSCADTLVRQHPERRDALRELLQELDQVGVLR